MTTRREFLQATGVLAVAPVLAPLAPGMVGAAHGGVLSSPARATVDLVIRGGTVFDGTGAGGQEMDVAIHQGRVVQLAARIADRGTEEIDAQGLAVAPGFIDIHSHGDSALLEDPRAESAIRQGVTTIVVGADGSSRFTGDSGDAFAEWSARTAGYKASVNVASMIGLGTVRGAVIGEVDRKATAAELTRMTAMVARAVKQGACGASTGLEYTPGAFASREELIALCKPLAALRLPYATHMRNEDDTLLEAIDESIAVARGAGCPLQISHLKMQGTRNWPKFDASIARIGRARASGVDAWFDVYPYVAYATGLTNLFPVWARDGGTSAFLARLEDPSVAPRIRAEALGKVDLIGGWNNVQISRVSAADDRDAEGRRLADWAKARGVDPYEGAVGLLRRNRADVGMLGFAMSEENLDRLLAHEFGMVCSDGGAFAIDGPTRRGSPHPRGAGTFPRVLGRYVRERKALSLASAINRMTARPASRVHLRDRGVLAPRMAGDVVVFDPATIADTATFANPFQYPVGIRAVVVNGRVAVRDGQHLTAAGQVLRAT